LRANSARCAATLNARTLRRLFELLVAVSAPSAVGGCVGTSACDGFVHTPQTAIYELAGAGQRIRSLETPRGRCGATPPPMRRALLIAMAILVPATTWLACSPAASPSLGALPERDGDVPPNIDGGAEVDAEVDAEVEGDVGVEVDGHPEASPHTDPIDDAVSALSSTCTPRPHSTPTCPAGVPFDDELQRCATLSDAYGPFAQYQIDACIADGGGPACATNRWERGFYATIAETSGLRGGSRSHR
jgi:hypothetical protein